jgi:hypothetical protein
MITELPKNIQWLTDPDGKAYDFIDLKDLGIPHDTETGFPLTKAEEGFLFDEASIDSPNLYINGNGSALVGDTKYHEIAISDIYTPDRKESIRLTRLAAENVAESLKEFSPMLCFPSENINHAHVLIPFEKLQTTTPSRYHDTINGLDLSSVPASDKKDDFLPSPTSPAESHQPVSKTL